MSDYSGVDLSEFGLDASELDFGGGEDHGLDENPNVEDVSDNLPEGAEVTAPEVDSFDWETVNDRPVKVKVGGEELEVPFSELRSGYMRQQDYTRKTQEAAAARADAEWARTVRQAFESDPAGTLRLFAQQLGVTEQPQPTDPFDGIDDPELVQAISPVMQELQATKAQLAAMQEWQARTEQERIVASVRAELEAARSEMPDVDATAALQLAYDKGVPIHDAFLYIAGQEALKAQRTAAETAKVISTKQAASAAVSSKPSHRTTAPQAVEYEDFEELFEMNLRTMR